MRYEEPEWLIVERRLGKRRQRRGRYVSINKRGEIAMNDDAWSAIRRAYNVTLLWNPRQRIIGVKFPRSVDRNFFPTRGYGRGRKMRVVRAGRLLKAAGLVIPETLRFPNTELVMWGEDPMLVLRLPKSE
jgi:hypothetical protein